MSVSVLNFSRILFFLFFSDQHFVLVVFQEPIKSRAPQLHLEYRFYKQLGSSGKAFHQAFIHSWTDALYAQILSDVASGVFCCFLSRPVCCENHGGGGC